MSVTALTLRCDEHGQPVDLADMNLVLAGHKVALVCNGCLAGSFTREHEHRTATR